MAVLRPTSLREARGPRFDEVAGWIGWRVDDLNGTMLGHVERTAGDDRGAPAWLVIAEFGLEDGRRFFVPARDAVGGAGRVWCPHDRALVRGSARLVGAELTPQAEHQLRSHYAPAARRAA